MKAYIESILDCSPELVWAEVQKSQLLLEIMRPLLRFAPQHGTEFPEKWQQGTTIHGRGFALSVIPLGLHKLHFESIDHEHRRIQTRESNRLVARWDHIISVREAPDGRTLYSDEIEIEAGWLTGAVWLFAQCFYRHRQRRWRRVARRFTNQREVVVSA